MTLTQLEYIVAVDKHRHFGKAAESCRVAQPSLSTQILKLEKELGVRIFERTKNSCITTEVGKEIVRQARLILDETARINDITASFGSEVKGSLRLGVIPTIAPYLLPSLLPVLQKAYPGLSIEIHEQRTSQLVSLIEQGDIDAAILSTPASAPETLKEKVLYYEPFVLFAAKSHALSKKERISQQDLEQHPPFLLDDTHCMRDQVEKICKAASSARSPIQIKSGSLQTLVEIVGASGGYTLLPILAEPFFKKTHPGTFKNLPEPKPARKVSLVFHRSFLKRPLIEALSSSILGHLPANLISVADRSLAKIISPRSERFD